MSDQQDRPHAPREYLHTGESPLKNGNRQGDYRNAPRCGAKTRKGTPCQGPCVQGRQRCRMHGGTSRGPTTWEGLERSRRGNWKTGYYSAKAIEERRKTRELIRQAKEFLEALDEAG